MVRIMGRVKWALESLFYGVVYGLVIYGVYGYLLPSLLSGAGLPLEAGDVGRRLLVFLPFLIGVEAVASATRGTVYAFVFRLMSKLMGVLLFVNAVGSGVLEGSYSLGGVTYSVTIDVSPIVAGVVLLSFPFMLLDVMGFVRRQATTG